MINIDYHRTHKNAYDWGMVCGIALPTLGASQQSWDGDRRLGDPGDPGMPFDKRQKWTRKCHLMINMWLIYC